MLPIVWQYLLKEYLKVILFSVIAFVAVLLTTRLDEIAHFAARDASGWLVIQFILYQIPYILPIAIPIGCLISALLLMKQLSETHELTALRACGMAIHDFLTPIFLCACLITLINFYLISEVATSSHFHTNQWKNELLLINPLLLLKNKHIMNARGAYFDALGHSKSGEVATQAVLAIPNKDQERIHLFLADEFRVDNGSLLSKQVSIVSTIEPNQSDEFDNLLIENMDNVQTPTYEFSQLLRIKLKGVKPDHLPMSLLIARIEENQINQNQNKENNIEDKQDRLNEQKNNENKIEDNQTNIQDLILCYSEIIRRISLSLAAFTFTLMGCAFGMTISRNHSQWGVAWVVLLAATYLISYFMARGFDQKLMVAIAFYLVPHLIIIGLSIRMLQRISKGIE